MAASTVGQQDAAVAALGQHLLTAAKQVEEQLDAEIERLDKLDDDELERIKQKRIDDMKRKQKQRQDWESAGHGEYSEVANEREFFDVCKRSKRVVCHFYRDATFRCKIVDKHLALLAPKHLETRFISANVDKVPFLIQRLNIRVMPTIACVNDGQTERYIRGFDELGGTDDFTTERLEWLLGTTRIINYQGDLNQAPADKNTKPKNPSILGRPTKSVRGKDDDSSDDDW